MATIPLQEIVLAGPRGFCAGVDRAIDIVELALQVCAPPVYVRREIVHNRHVVEALRAKGAHFVDELHQVPDDATVIFSAHGVSPAVRHEAQQRGLHVIDATCPLVTKVHLEAVRFAREGYTILRIDHERHDDVLGTTGEPPACIRLVQLATSCGRPAYLIDGRQEIRDEWFQGGETVMITAGASAPEEVVEECIAYLRDRYGATVESRTVREEHVNFPLPRELRVLAP